MCQDKVRKSKKGKAYSRSVPILMSRDLPEGGVGKRSKFRIALPLPDSVWASGHSNLNKSKSTGRTPKVALTGEGILVSTLCNSTLVLQQPLSVLASFWAEMPQQQDLLTSKEMLREPLIKHSCTIIGAPIEDIATRMAIRRGSMLRRVGICRYKGNSVRGLIKMTGSGVQCPQKTGRTPLEFSQSHLSLATFRQVSA